METTHFDIANAPVEELARLEPTIAVPVGLALGAVA